MLILTGHNLLLGPDSLRRIAGFRLDDGVSHPFYYYVRHKPRPPADIKGARIQATHLRAGK
jgi:hypothetical protein